MVDFVGGFKFVVHPKAVSVQLTCRIISFNLYSLSIFVNMMYQYVYEYICIGCVNTVYKQCYCGIVM